MFEQLCSAKVLQHKNQNRWSHVWTVAQHWTFLLCDEDNGDSDDLYVSKEQLTLSVYHLDCRFPLSDDTQKDLDSLGTGQPPPSPELGLAACVDMQGTNRRVDFTWDLPERNIWSVHFICHVCLIDHPTTIALPEIAVRDYLFWWTSSFF